MTLCTLTTTSFAVARVAIGVVIGAAGVSKLLSKSLRDSLRQTLHELSVSTPPIAVPLLAFAELSLGGWLVSGHAVTLAATSACGMLTLFSFALLILLHRGYRGNCGCFLGGGNAISIAHVVRNGVLLIVCVPLAVWPSGNQCLARSLGGSDTDVWSLALALTVCVVGASVLLGQMSRLLRPANRKRVLT